MFEALEAKLKKGWYRLPELYKEALDNGVVISKQNFQLALNRLVKYNEIHLLDLDRSKGGKRYSLLRNRKAFLKMMEDEYGYKNL